MPSFTLTYQSLPERLQHIPQPPQCLYVASDNWDDLLQRPAVAIVGSRQPTAYGRSVTRQLAGDLAAQGVVIVSGLAYGVDSLAHEGALASGGLTLAVLPAGLASVYPRSHRRLAEQVLSQGGALVSEYDNACQQPQRYQFVERNRLIAGFSRIVIVTEAGLASGSRHTVDFANEQGRDVMAVPGAITNPLSAGPNQHLRDGAGVVLEYQDVLRALGIGQRPITEHMPGYTAAESNLLNLIYRGVSQQDDLRRQSRLSIADFNLALTVLEVVGRIHNVGGNHWSLT